MFFVSYSYVANRRVVDIHYRRIIKRDLKRAKEINQHGYSEVDLKRSFRCAKTEDKKPVPWYVKVGSVVVPAMLLWQLASPLFSKTPVRRSLVREAAISAINPHSGFTNSTINEITISGLESQLSARFNTTLNDTLEHIGDLNSTQRKQIFNNAYENASDVLRGAKNITGSIKRAFFRTFNESITEQLEEKIEPTRGESNGEEDPPEEDNNVEETTTNNDETADNNEQASDSTNQDEEGPKEEQVIEEPEEEEEQKITGKTVYVSTQKKSLTKPLLLLLLGLLVVVVVLQMQLVSNK